MQQIKLTQGKVALVDDQDYEYLSQFKWQYHSKRYAARGKNLGKINGHCKRKTSLMHREIMNAPDALNKIEVDHINHNGLDNCRQNLRLVTKQQNQFNRPKSLRKQLTSKYKGVNLRKDELKKPWEAQICINRKKIRIGLFANEIEAAKAYDQKARELYGQYASINFIYEKVQNKIE